MEDSPHPPIPMLPLFDPLLILDTFQLNIAN